MQEEIIFTLTIDDQKIEVRYYPRYFASVGYAHFEFRSPHTPPRRIPISATGFKSHFSPVHEIEAAPSVEEYARALILALMGHQPDADDEEAEGEEGDQLALL